MAIHSSPLAWKIPWTEEPGRLYSPWDSKQLHMTEQLHFLQKVPCMHCRTQCPRACTRPLPTHASTGDSWTLKASLGHSPVGSLLLSPGPWCTQGFICALQGSVSPVLCKFWRLCGGVNGDLLLESLCQTQVCCTQSPCGRPLLTHTSSGDTQTQFWLSFCAVSGSCCAQGFVCALQESVSPHSWPWWRLLTKHGPLEKGMASHFSILALRTAWTVWKGKKIGHWKMNSPGW